MSYIVKQAPTYTNSMLNSITMPNTEAEVKTIDNFSNVACYNMMKTKKKKKQRTTRLTD